MNVPRQWYVTHIHSGHPPERHSVHTTLVHLPSRDAKSCVSQAKNTADTSIFPPFLIAYSSSGDAKSCVSTGSRHREYMTVSDRQDRYTNQVETQNFASHKQKTHISPAYPRHSSLHILPRETQNLASLLLGDGGYKGTGWHCGSCGMACQIITDGTNFVTKKTKKMCQA